ncbi:MAG: exopolyphosphatase [Flavobacteriia bacterium]|nr:MAG: exopolyphosphatase [Flavobacteriia bacterium]
MNIKKYAAIDIGSNGVRILISNILLNNGNPPIFRKSSLVRVPIRLGADTFGDGVISPQNITRMTDAMQAYKLLMNVHGVEKYRAFATSAMRGADNSAEVIEHIKNKTGITIEIIDGKTEAEIISSSDFFHVLDPKKNYLFVDVGGGSTEFTLIKNGKKIDSKSFKMGTVRLLDKNYDISKMWEEAKQWVKKATKDCNKVTLIGSGGNIVRVYKMGNSGIGKPISLDYLKEKYKLITGMTYDERMVNLGFNPDRADVIIPALEIFMATMKWANAKKILVPKFGLADGMIKAMFYDNHPEYALSKEKVNRS